MFPDNGDMHASVETIRQAICLQAGDGLKQEPKRAVGQGRTARRPQGGQGRKPRFREPMVMISERVHETKREDHRTARRRVTTSTTDNAAMEDRSNLRRCNHH